MRRMLVPLAVAGAFTFASGSTALATTNPEDPNDVEAVDNPLDENDDEGFDDWGLIGLLGLLGLAGLKRRDDHVHVRTDDRTRVG